LFFQLTVYTDIYTDFEATYRANSIFLKQRENKKLLLPTLKSW